MRRNLTAYERERHLEQSRRQEEVREDTIHRLGREKLLEANLINAEKLDNKRYIRQAMVEKKEREMEESILKVR